MQLIIKWIDSFIRLIVLGLKNKSKGKQNRAAIKQIYKNAQPLSLNYFLSLSVHTKIPQRYRCLDFGLWWTALFIFFFFFLNGNPAATSFTTFFLILNLKI